MSRLTVLDEVAWDGRGVPGDRTAALLRALAGAGPGGLSDGELVDEVWADGAPANPRKALQVVVSRARNATSAEVIERTRRGYKLNLDPSDVDAWSLRPRALRLAGEGRHAEALPLLSRALPERDGDDEVLAALLRALAAVQGIPAALARYEEYRSTLADRLGVDPSPELQALHASLLAADRPVRSGVRYDADRLVGREADVAALRVLVRTHRVVSIIGTGGLGKTRLAHLIARSAQQPVVHVVELAGVTSPAGVAVEVADALGVRESSAGRTVALRPADLLTRLVDAVGTVPTLLVLDNCEHLVEAAAELVAALVSRAPRLTVLTTSRVPLGLPAERAYPLPELPADEAAVLFAERATAARPGVVLDPAEVHDLVVRLDGLPLALELAAAKVRAMSVAEITRRLDNRFALLRGGSRAAPERHQTLLAVIDWSWNLLTEQQRAALRRVAVFRDGFSLDGATAVLGQDARDVVGELVDHSLVVVREATGVRYRLLETVREFGWMQLVDAGEDDLAEQRLQVWATDLAQRAGERISAADQIPTMALVRAEEGNLVDVLRRSLAARDSRSVTVLFGVLAGFWTVEGAHAKVVNLGPAVVDLLLSAPTPPELADGARVCLSVAGTNEMIFQGTVTAALLDRLRELGPGSTPQVAPVVRVLVESLADSLADGHDRLARLEVLAEDPDPAVSRLALMWASHAYENMGDLGAARAAAVRSLDLCDDSHGPWMRGILSANIASLAFQAGEFGAVRSYAQAALPVLAALGAAEDYAQTRALLGMLALHEGRLDEAEQIFDEVAALDGARALFGGAMELMCGRAELLLARGQTDAGLAAYAEGLAAIRERTLPGRRASTFAPWVLFTHAAALCASVRHGRSARAIRDEIVAGAAAATRERAFIDVPVLGSAFFALAVWELHFGDPDAGACLLAYAQRFAYNRMLPGFDWAWATSLAQPAAIDPGDPASLLDQVHALLTALTAHR